METNNPPRKVRSTKQVQTLPDVAEAVKLIAEAAKEAGKLIASASEDAKRALANAASEAVKVNNVQGSGDHDLLIELKTLMTVMQTTVTEIKTGTAAQISDHESRIKDVEKKVSNSFITTAIYTLATIAMISLMVGHMLIK